MVASCSRTGALQRDEVVGWIAPLNTVSSLGRTAGTRCRCWAPRPGLARNEINRYTDEAVNAPASPSQSSAAFSRMPWNTALRSPGSALISRNVSVVAESNGGPSAQLTRLFPPLALDRLRPTCSYPSERSCEVRGIGFFAIGSQPSMGRRTAAAGLESARTPFVVSLRGRQGEATLFGPDAINELRPPFLVPRLADRLRSDRPRGPHTERAPTRGAPTAVDRARPLSGHAVRLPAGQSSCESA